MLEDYSPKDGFGKQQQRGGREGVQLEQPSSHDYDDSEREREGDEEMERTGHAAASSYLRPLSTG